MKYGRLCTDGGARGNPGPAASAAVLFEVDAEGQIKNETAKTTRYVGIATNNQAEYEAVIIGLQKARECGFDMMEVLMDSELIVEQMNGNYRVRNEELAKKFLEVHRLIQSFRRVTFRHVRREENRQADALVNKTIDEALGG
ncbi:MAG: ribonuclease HI family protein [Patescibacteria group bacterium]|jgi:ribonuclease HI